VQKRVVADAGHNAMTPDDRRLARQYTAGVRVALEADNVRIAEVVATLSYAADLGLGQPMAHCMRQTVIALRLAELVGANNRELEATYYLGLMMNVYCHADAAEQAQWFGDDIRSKADVFETLEMNTARTIAFILRRVGSHGSGLERAKRLAAFPVEGLAGTRPMNLLMGHQAKQPTVQQGFPSPRNPASITSQDVAKHSGR
jgi:hypothetical protein